MGIFELSDRLPFQCHRMGKVQVPEQAALADFPRILDACIIIGKNVCSRGEADLIEILGACLRKDNGIGLFDMPEDIGVNPPVPKDDLNMSIEAWMK
jgi:hypothetical protein